MHCKQLRCGMHVTQGAHGLWELSVNKAYHADLVEDLLEALVAQLACPDLQVSHSRHSKPCLWLACACCLVCLSVHQARIHEDYLHKAEPACLLQNDRICCFMFDFIEVCLGSLETNKRSRCNVHCQEASEPAGHGRWSKHQQQPCGGVLPAPKAGGC